MSRWLFVTLHLLMEAQAARRDARIRFLLSQVRILRGKLHGNRVIVSPEDRAGLLAIGQELSHDVKDVIGIVTTQTYRRWLREQKSGRKHRAVGRPRVSAMRRQLIVRFAKENFAWGYRRIVGELRKLQLSVSRSTIRRILLEEGLVPPPNTGRHVQAFETPWRTGPPVPLERPSYPRRDPFRRRSRPQASRLGFNVARRAFMLEQNGPAMERGEGHTGNVGWYTRGSDPYGPDGIEPCVDA